MTHLDDPAEITLFLDRLHAAGQRVVEGSQIEFVRHPEKPGQWVGVVEVEEAEKVMGTKDEKEVKVKALSLWEPWAILVAIEAKKYETRSWETPYRGPLVIHAAKRFTDEERALCRTEPFYSCLTKASYLTVKRLPFGAYVCVVDLVDIIETSEIRDHLSQQERAFGDYSDGRYAWKLENVRRFPEPIPARGYQNLWTPLVDKRFVSLGDGGGGVMTIGSTLITSYLQKGESEPIRARIRLVSANQIELKQRHSRLSGIKPWHMLTTVTRTGARTQSGSLVFSNAYTEFYISPADWRRLTGEGFEA